MDDEKRNVRTVREYLKDSRKSMEACAWVWQEFVSKDSKRWTKWMLAAVIAVTTCSMLGPLCMKYVIDGLAAKDARLVLFGMGGILFFYLIQRFLDNFQCKARERVSSRNLEMLDRRTNEMFFEKSMGQHLHESSVLSASNVEKGRGRVTQMQDMLLFDGIYALVNLLLAFLFLCFLSLLAGAAMAGLIILYIAFALYLNQKVMLNCIPLDTEFRKLNRKRVERWDKIERVKTCAKEQAEISEMEQELHGIILRDNKFWFWFIDVITARGFMNVLTHVAILSYGTWQVWIGHWSLGLLYPLFAWTSKVAENIWQIGRLEQQLNWNMPSILSMKEALSIPRDIFDSPEAVRLSRDAELRVEFNKVSYSYPAGEKEPHTVLQNICFAIEPFEKVALIGPSGAGKTTIMRLVQRFMDPTEGTILVNGTDLKKIALDTWLDMLAYIPQQSQILDGTIRYNLLYGLSAEERGKVSDEDVWNLMRLLKIDFGDRLKEGLDTLVGRNGVKLSGGEQQRLMIGAAAMRRPKLMVIDEATSSLDSTTERQVQQGLETVLGPDTAALVITHRLSTVRDLCTKFIVLKDSELKDGSDSQVEAISDSFEELNNVSPTFRRLAKDQGVVIAGDEYAPSLSLLAS